MSQERVTVHLVLKNGIWMGALFDGLGPGSTVKMHLSRGELSSFT